MVTVKLRHKCWRAKKNVTRNISESKLDQADRAFQGDNRMED